MEKAEGELSGPLSKHDKKVRHTSEWLKRETDDDNQRVLNGKNWGFYAQSQQIRGNSGQVLARTAGKNQY